MDDTLQRIANLYDSLYWISPLLNPNIGKAEPPANVKITGLLAYADGSTWNPGNGVGLYVWSGSAWLPFWASFNDGTGSGLDADLLDGHDSSYFSVAGSSLIWDKTVTGSAVTSVTTNGEVTLDGNTHGGYEFEFIIYNTTVSSIIYSMFYNNNTTQTDYYDAIPGTNNAAYIANTVAANYVLRLNGFISQDPAGIVTAQYFNTIFTNTGSILSLASCTHVKLTAVSGAPPNLTRIDIVSPTASGLGINSRFRLWRRT